MGGGRGACSTLTGVCVRLRLPVISHRAARRFRGTLYYYQFLRPNPQALAREPFWPERVLKVNGADLPAWSRGAGP